MGESRAALVAAQSGLDALRGSVDAASDRIAELSAALTSARAHAARTADEAGAAQARLRDDAAAAARRFEASLAEAHAEADRRAAALEALRAQQAELVCTRAHALHCAVLAVARLP